MLSGVVLQVSVKEQLLKMLNGYSKFVVKKVGGCWIVMLDLGYGGIDIGVIGYNGLKEKYVVLVIVKNVCSILCSNGIDVCLICIGDIFILLYDCVEIVYQYGVDLFMLIYVDGFINLSVVGVLVFVLLNCGVSSVMVKYFFDCENCVDEVVGKKVMDKDYLLQQVLFDLVQIDIIKNSLMLGLYILKKIKLVYKLYSCNIEQVVFVVLKLLFILFVLVEILFIINLNEEKLFGIIVFWQKIVIVIVNGIISYFYWFDNQKVYLKRC